MSESVGNANGDTFGASHQNTNDDVMPKLVSSSSSVSSQQPTLAVVPSNPPLIASTPTSLAASTTAATSVAARRVGPSLPPGMKKAAAVAAASTAATLPSTTPSSSSSVTRRVGPVIPAGVTLTPSTSSSTMILLSSLDNATTGNATNGSGYTTKNNNNNNVNDGMAMVATSVATNAASNDVADRAVAAAGAAPLPSTKSKDTSTSTTTTGSDGRKRRRRRRYEEETQVDTTLATPGHATVQSVVDAKDHFEVLRLPRPSSDDFGRMQWPVSIALLKKHFRTMSLVTHPDKNPDETQAQAAFESVQKSYKFMMDESLREAYVKSTWEQSERDRPRGWTPDMALSEKLKNEAEWARRSLEIRREAFLATNKKIVDKIKAAVEAPKPVALTSPATSALMAAIDDDEVKQRVATMVQRTQQQRKRIRHHGVF